MSVVQLGAATPHTAPPASPTDLLSLFDPRRMPVFVGTRPERVPAQLGLDDRFIVTSDADVLVNVCRHEPRPLFTRDARTAVANDACLVCPHHRWRYDLEGAYVSGQRAEEGCDLAPRDLIRVQSIEWNGFVFAVADEATGAAFLAHLGDYDRHLRAAGIDAPDLAHWEAWGQPSVDRYEHASVRHFFEVFGDDKHVPVVHPGLASFADCRAMTWFTTEIGHAQVLPFPAGALERAADQDKDDHDRWLYAQWIIALAEHRERLGLGRGLPPRAVVWAGIYPGLMMEFYSDLLALSMVRPNLDGRGCTNVVQFYVPKGMADVSPGLPDTMIDAFLFTAEQDQALVESLAIGEMTMASLGLESRYEPDVLSRNTLELGVAHYHEWLRAQFN
jgi:nitrite reductase/ring-hydroxylating ferredoxin subunit